MGNLYLEPVTEEHLGVIVASLNDPKVNKFLSLEGEVELGLAKLELQNMGDENRVFAILRRTDNRYIGQIGLHSIKDGVASVGIVIEKKFWGCGYAIEANHLLFEKAREMGLQSLTAEVQSGNRSSIRCCQLLGFTLEGTKDGYEVFVRVLT